MSLIQELKDQSLREIIIFSGPYIVEMTKLYLYDLQVSFSLLNDWKYEPMNNATL